MLSQTILKQITETAHDRLEYILTDLGIDIDDAICTYSEIRCSCPIHGGTCPTSFCYYVQDKRWRCFSENCHDGKDSIFGLVQIIKELSFQEAVEWLATRCSIDTKQPVKEYKLTAEEKILDESVRAMRSTNRIKERLTNTEPKISPIPLWKAKRSLVPDKCFLKDGITPETLAKFNVGYCTDPKKPMFRRSYALVLDEKGQDVVGVTGRIDIRKPCELCGAYHDKNILCYEDGGPLPFPKWKHFGFESGKVLYNSWNAAESVSKTKVAILCEGPKDVWWLDQHGVHNGIAIFGLNITPYHVKTLIEMNATTVLMCLDKDDSGEKGKIKASDVLKECFRLGDISKFLRYGEDIADVSSDRVFNEIVPYINKWESHAE